MQPAPSGNIVSKGANFVIWTAAAEVAALAEGSNSER
jgi:hypothetical protein